MKTRSIPLRCHEVRGILGGRQTQVRRVMKPQPHGANGRTEGIYRYADGPRWIAMGHDQEPAGEPMWQCPYGEPGDRLWARETWCRLTDIETDGHPTTTYYAATDDAPGLCDGDGFAVFRKDGREASPWRPSIYMPRKLARITLEITDVRVERLQAISEEDANAEGVEIDGGYFKNYTRSLFDLSTARGSFGSLWASIHGMESWRADRWVWAITFRRVVAA